jgi:hypothetical protein
MLTSLSLTCAKSNALPQRQLDRAVLDRALCPSNPLQQHVVVLAAALRASPHHLLRQGERARKEEQDGKGVVMLRLHNLLAVTAVFTVA